MALAVFSLNYLWFTTVFFFLSPPPPPAFLKCFHPCHDILVLWYIVTHVMINYILHGYFTVFSPLFYTCHLVAMSYIAPESFSSPIKNRNDMFALVLGL